MKINYKTFEGAKSTEPTITFEAFADKYDLELDVHERAHDASLGGQALSRYYARFADVEVMKDGMLSGFCGQGETIPEAIKNYANRLRGQRIAVNAYKTSRQEIQCPNVWKE